MIANKVLQFWKSKIIIVLTIALLLLIAGNYYTNYVEKTEWQKVYESKAKDVNLEKVNEIISGYTTMGYVEKFVFSDDFYIIFWIVIIIGLSISLSATTINELKTNYGTMIMARTTYRNYITKLLFSQILFMISYLAVFFSIAFLLTQITLGFDFSVPVNSSITSPSLLVHFLLLLANIMHMSLYAICLVLLTSVSGVYVKNIYVIQMLPFFIIILAYVAGSTIGNINFSFAKFSYYIIIDSAISSFNSIILKHDYTLSNFLASMGMTIVFFITFLRLYRLNVHKFSKDYLL